MNFLHVFVISFYSNAFLPVRYNYNLTCIQVYTSRICYWGRLYTCMHQFPTPAYPPHTHTHDAPTPSHTPPTHLHLPHTHTHVHSHPCTPTIAMYPQTLTHTLTFTPAPVSHPHSLHTHLHLPHTHTHIQRWATYLCSHTCTPTHIHV